MKQILLLTIIISLFLFPCLAQTNKNKKQKLNKSKVIKKKPAIFTSEKGRQEQREIEPIEKEASYYAFIRYVIVYDWIFDGKERRMDILMDEKQFSEKNLIAVFELIKKKFSSPFRLEIEVHTSLATIETPEENEMYKDDVDSRFSNTYSKYKRATYTRFDGGREAFIYTTNLSPYQEKTIVLVDKKI